MAHHCFMIMLLSIFHSNVKVFAGGVNGLSLEVKQFINNQTPSSSAGSKPSVFSPIYTCQDKVHGVSQGAWYSSCRSSCDGDKSIMNIFIQAKTDSYKHTTKYIWKTRTTKTTVLSKENLWATCYHTVINTKLIVPSGTLKETLRGYLNRTTQDHGIIYIGDTPDCNYFSDHESVRYEVTYERESWKLHFDIHGKAYFTPLDTSDDIPYSAGEHVTAEHWYSWDVKKVEIGCQFVDLGNDNCQVYNTHIHCPHLGITFKDDIVRSMNQTCAGDLLFSSDGMVYTPGIRGTHLSNFSRTTELIYKVQDLNIRGAMDTAVSLLVEFEKKMCTSICDIVEDLIPLNHQTGVPLETPIGSWLSLLNYSGFPSLVSCQSRRILSVVTPIQLCKGLNLLRVVDNSDNSLYWWNPMTLFVTHDTKCLDPKEGTEWLDHLFTEKISYQVHFWRGTYVIDYPYNKTGYWVERKQMMMTSSKWISKSSYVDHKVSLEVKDLEENLIASTNSLHKEYLELRGSTKSYSEASGVGDKISSLFVSTLDTARTIYGKVKGFVEDISHLITILVLVITSILFFSVGKFIVGMGSHSSRSRHEEGGSYYNVNEGRTIFVR